MAWYSPDGRVIARSVWSELLRTNTTIIRQSFGSGYRNAIVQNMTIPMIAKKYRVMAVCKNNSTPHLIDRQSLNPDYGVENIIETGFDPTNYKDFNIYSYATPATTSIPANTEIDLVEYDLITQRQLVYIFIKYSIYLGRLKIYPSPDCVNYGIPLDLNGIDYMMWSVDNVRCIKISAFNDTANAISNSNIRIHNFEIYDANSASAVDSTRTPQRLIEVEIGSPTTADKYYSIFAGRYPWTNEYCEYYLSIW